MSSYTAQQIQSIIESKKGLTFTYNYSQPGVMRFVHPMAIVGNNVVVTESITGKIKKFKLDGIQLFKNNQPIDDPECEAYKLTNSTKMSSEQSTQKIFITLIKFYCSYHEIENYVAHSYEKLYNFLKKKYNLNEEKRIYEIEALKNARYIAINPYVEEYNEKNELCFSSSFEDLEEQIDNLYSEI